MSSAVRNEKHWSGMPRDYKYQVEGALRQHLPIFATIHQFLISTSRYSFELILCQGEAAAVPMLGKIVLETAQVGTASLAWKPSPNYDWTPEFLRCVLVVEWTSMFMQPQ